MTLYQLLILYSIKLHIQSVSKLNGKTSGSDSSYRVKKKVYDNMVPDMHNYIVSQRDRILHFYIYGLLNDTVSTLNYKD
jgi:hypothetical protein